MSTNRARVRRILVIDDNHAIHQDFAKVLDNRRPAAEVLEELENDLFGDVNNVEIFLDGVNVASLALMAGCASPASEDAESSTQDIVSATSGQPLNTRSDSPPQ